MVSAAATILRAYFSVCTFRSGPQDMPSAAAFLILSVALYTLTSVALLMPYQAPAIAVMSGLVDTGLALFLTWAILLFNGLRYRFHQTASALTGTGFLFSLFALPLFVLRSWIGDESTFILIVSFALLLLIIWNIAVMAHILRHAVSAPFAVGVLLALGYVWLITVALALVSPSETAP